jgi:hypothetical protein
VVWLPIVTIEKIWQGQDDILGIDLHTKDCLYQWKFLSFGLKNTLDEFQNVMDWMLVGLGFAKCYTNDIIIFNLILGVHMYHLQKVFWKP